MATSGHCPVRARRSAVRCCCDVGPTSFDVAGGGWRTMGPAGVVGGACLAPPQNCAARTLLVVHAAPRPRTAPVGLLLADYYAMLQAQAMAESL